MMGGKSVRILFAPACQLSLMLRVFTLVAITLTKNICERGLRCQGATHTNFFIPILKAFTLCWNGPCLLTLC